MSRWAPAVVVALAAVVIAAVLGAPASAAPFVRGQAKANGDRLERFWTSQRLERAKPLEAIRRRGAEPKLRVARNHSEPYLSAEIPDPNVSPNTTNGRLFGKIRNIGLYSCSATSLDTPNGRVIFTAGHCVFDPRQGRFAKQLVFVPAYRDGTAPFGVWYWRSALTPTNWARNANANFDYASIELAKGGNGERIEDLVGGRVLAKRSPRRQTYAAYGYPINLAGGERMWGCLSAYAGKDPRPFRLGKAANSIGCDMTGGASGGGWIGESGKLVSVSSFRYREHPEILYGPKLGRNATRMVRRAGR